MVCSHHKAHWLGDFSSSYNLQQNRIFDINHTNIFLYDICSKVRIGRKLLRYWNLEDDWKFLDFQVDGGCKWKSKKYRLPEIAFWSVKTIVFLSIYESHRGGVYCKKWGWVARSSAKRAQKWCKKRRFWRISPKLWKSLAYKWKRSLFW